MTRSNTITQPKSFPVVVYNGTDDAFPSSLNHPQLPNNSFLTLMHLTCEKNESLSSVNKIISLANTDVLTRVRIDKRSPVTGLLTKYWKSASVLCERDGADSIVRGPNKTQVRKKSSVRSCERGSALKGTADLVITAKCNGCVDGELSLSQPSNEFCDGRLARILDLMHSHSYKTDNISPGRSSHFNGYKTGSWNNSTCSNSDGSVTPTTNTHSSGEIVSDRYLDEKQIKTTSHDNHVLESLMTDRNKKGESCGDLQSSNSEPKEETNEDEWLSNGKSDAQSSIGDENIPAEKNDDEVNRTNLIVNYLPQNMTQEEIRSLFATIGEVDSCKLIKDKNTNQNLGYGFVNYVHSKDAERAIAALNGMQLHNKTIKVSLARPSSESIKGANLYISGLPQSMTQEELEKLFNQCGRIITSRILYDNNTGLSRGVGFIRFDQRVEAELAIKQLNGVIPATGTEPITVKLANSPASGTSNANSFIALNNQCLNPHLSEIGRSIRLDSVSKDLISSTKSNPTALAMMLLHQITSQTGTPFNQAIQLPRFTPTSTTAALLPFPAPCNMNRLGRPVVISRPLNHSIRRISSSAPVSMNNSILPHHQNKLQEHDPGTRNTAPIPFSPGNQAIPNSNPVLPAMFNTQPHLLTTPLQPPLFYQRFRYPTAHRVVGMPTSHNNMTVTGFMSPTYPTQPSTVPLAAYSLTDYNGPLNHDCFLPYPPQSLTTVGSAGLPYAEMANFSLPMGLGVHNPANSLVTPVPGIPILSNFPQIAPNLNPFTTSAPFCLFVSNLPPEADDSTLWRLFGPFGAVRSVKVVREAGTNRCKGFGFVNMLNYAEALLAIQQLNNFSLGNRFIHVAFKNHNYS